MTEITEQVRAQYDRFPYPATRGQLRADSFLDLLLSYVSRRSMRSDRPLQVLDAGCGTGSGTVSVAALHPDARLVGVDLSAVALEEARHAAEEEGVHNLALIQADILDSGQLPTASGGYDVIYASGVLHHLADPALGLRNLAGLLAPHGIMVVMVYGHWGRLPVFRMAQAMDRLAPDRADFDGRMTIARDVLAAASGSAVTAPPWADATQIPDNELVDRYLHRHDRGYTVPELFALLDKAKLGIVRWLEPRAWDLSTLMAPGPGRDRLAALSPRVRYEVLDLLYDHPDLSLVVAGPAAGPRAPLTLESLRHATVEWNPQAAIRSTARLVHNHVQVSDLEVMVRHLRPYPVSGLAAALVQAASQPTRGAALVQTTATQTGAPEPELWSTLIELLQLEILFVP